MDFFSVEFVDVEISPQKSPRFGQDPGSQLFLLGLGPSRSKNSGTAVHLQTSHFLGGLVPLICVLFSDVYLLWFFGFMSKKKTEP